MCFSLVLNLTSRVHFQAEMNIFTVESLLWSLNRHHRWSCDFLLFYSVDVIVFPVHPTRMENKTNYYACSHQLGHSENNNCFHRYGNSKVKI